MNKMVVGQPQAIEKMSDSFSRLIAGVHDPERPLLTMMFMGPTGVGKTETVRALAETVFGNRRAFTRINCQEYSAHYNISKLLGSPRATWAARSGRCFRRRTSTGTTARRSRPKRV